MTAKHYPTIGEIRRAHGIRRGYERYLFANTYFFRPLSYWLTWLAVRLGLSSEMVSWLSGAAALGAFACLLWPAGPLLWQGVSLLFLFNFLDCVDGDVSRVMRTRNPYGRFLDTIMWWADMLFWGAVGVAAWRLPELRALGGAWGLEPGVWLAAGAACAFLASYAAYLDSAFDLALGRWWTELLKKEGSSPAPTPIEGKPPLEAAARVLVHNLRVRETQYLLLAAAFALRFADALLVFYLAFYLALAASLLFAYCRRGRRIYAAGLGREEQD